MTRPVWTPGTMDPGDWQQEPGGLWYQHSAGTAWYQVKLPGWWHRLTHRCRAHSVGVRGWDVMLRCVCGAVRKGTTDPHRHAINPRYQPLAAEFATSWRHRNSRYRGTALIYHPHIRPLKAAQA